MGGPDVYQRWIGNYFNGYELHTPDGNVWKFGKKLSERTNFCPAIYSKRGIAMSEAQAVYCCHQIEGDAPGMEIIIKVHLQAPPKHPISRNPEVRRRLAEEEPFTWVTQEASSLRRLNDLGCRVTPELFHVAYTQQSDDMPVPDGYLVFIMMEKVPGISLAAFWDFDFAKREKIRAAFRESLSELYRCHASSHDSHLGNLVYDEERNKCWIIDYEHIFLNERTPPPGFYDEEYLLWGLAYERGGKELPNGHYPAHSLSIIPHFNRNAHQTRASRQKLDSHPAMTAEQPPVDPSPSPDPTAEARTAFLASLKSVGSNLDTDLRARASTLHENAAIIQKQEAELKRTTDQLAKQGNELEKLADQGQQGLKEVGDLQNWAEMMERDLLIVEESLRLADEEDLKNGKMKPQQEGRQRKKRKNRPKYIQNLLLEITILLQESSPNSKSMLVGTLAFTFVVDLQFRPLVPLIPPAQAHQVPHRRPSVRAIPWLIDRSHVSNDLLHLFDRKSLADHDARSTGTHGKHFAYFTRAGNMAIRRL
ncbi:hypothetical protein UREG_06512 [Uncinocarpus reesii 1704]|uniref:Biogenesis of lysosome-related organelles complex 1 subunit 1 n=1 Tax=Uncinocarpus reesii (strain UAMH 1704) TaxID=336963 RepID=C4JVC0_UNCRE|nr:uncharacterized protein UREG_06512 [Uncinocarpus reesii 1704]EEP81647.1 hypothetical protein UREG_06512 [Uncinocarpus reesii 1704]